MKYISTKCFPNLGPCVFRQWRADSHCRFLHGYSLSFYFEFESDTLDANNWVIDFGSLDDLKKTLELWFDHTLLVARDDPEMVILKHLQKKGLAKITFLDKIGCEGLASFLYTYVNNFYLPMKGYTKTIWCSKVEVREHEKNSAMVVGHRQ